MVAHGIAVEPHALPPDASRSSPRWSAPRNSPARRNRGLRACSRTAAESPMSSSCRLKPITSSPAARHSRAQRRAEPSAAAERRRSSSRHRSRLHQRLPPRAILHIPVDGLANALLVLMPRLPLQLAMRLGRIDRVTPVVAEPVGHIFDERLSGLPRCARIIFTTSMFRISPSLPTL